MTLNGSRSNAKTQRQASQRFEYVNTIDSGFESARLSLYCKQSKFARPARFFSPNELRHQQISARSSFVDPLIRWGHFRLLSLRPSAAPSVFASLRE
jgi:hypothetical protein